MRKNEILKPNRGKRIAVEEQYDLVVRWLHIMREIERCCIFISLGLSIVPIVANNTLVAAVTPWVCAALLATAISADFMRGFLTAKADYYHDRIKEDH